MIFRSYRAGGIGSGDCWISFRENGQWGELKNLGEPIDSRYNEMYPKVITDGKLLLYSSGRFEQEYYENSPKKLSEVAEDYKHTTTGDKTPTCLMRILLKKGEKISVQTSSLVNRGKCRFCHDKGQTQNQSLEIYWLGYFTIPTLIQMLNHTVNKLMRTFS